MIDIKKLKKVHFIGIGGSGMSGLAMLMHEMGMEVVGSDSAQTSITDQLIRENIDVYIGHSARNLSANAELVVYSLSIPDSNPELALARERNQNCLTYPAAIGMLSRLFKTICICGTHGKTTTTAMLAITMINASLDPSVIVGSKVGFLGDKSERKGNGEYLVLEACEYRRAFMNYQPYGVIINNIEADHLDYYKDEKDYQSAFLDFLKLVPAGGFIVANTDDPGINEILSCYKGAARVISFGRKSAAQYVLDQNQIRKNGEKIITLDLKIPGEHNKMNAAAVAAAALTIDISAVSAEISINKFSGTARRFEYRGMYNGIPVIDDYAHHPTEIRATLQAVREKFGVKSKVLCVFQPHQFSRTRHLMEDFATAFHGADMVIIPNILAVRDSSEEIAAVTPQKLVERIKQAGTNAIYGESFTQTIDLIKNSDQSFDVILTVGAGDIYEIADILAA